MSYIRIPLDPPPDNIDPELKEWLTRLLFMINGALDGVIDFTPTGIYPDKLENGLTRYFTQSIVDDPSHPDITEAGPWMWVEGQWRLLFG